MNELDSISTPLSDDPSSPKAAAAADRLGPGGESGGSANELRTASDGSGDPSAPIVERAGTRTPSYWFLGVVSFVTMALDLATKTWAERRLDKPDAWAHPVEVISGHLDFVLAKNRGGAWGLFQETSESIRKPFFMLVSLAAIAFIVGLYRRLGPKQHALRWGLPIVLGGALGNLVDRVRYSYVIDFIHMHVRWGGQDHHWPTYNVADIAICVGVGLMAIDMFSARRPEPHDTHDAA